MNIAQAKQISLFDVLASLGHHPAYTANGGDDVWYISPFRHEDTPSFHISLKHNCWFDFAESNKGDRNSILDFVMKYKNTDIKGALQFLERQRITPATQKLILEAPQPSLFTPEVGGARVEVSKVVPLFSFPLKDYLQKERGIDLELGYKYLKEVKYKILEGPNQGKEFYSLGFQNRAGGWALRNKYFKTATKPNDITVIETGSEKVAVYEGFMNFLSHLTIEGKKSPSNDVVVLNSNSLKAAGAEFIRMKNYSMIDGYLDNDGPGEKTFQYFKAEFPAAENRNNVFQGCNDFNEFLLRQKNKDSFSRG